MQMTNIIRHSEGRDYFRRSGSACFGAMSLPVEEMATAGEAIVGCDLTPPKDALSVTPSPLAMAKLQRLHAAAGRWLKTLPRSLPIPRQRAVSSRR